MINKLIVLSIVVFFTFPAKALTEEERVGGLAGQLYGAVMLANEFVRTPCGRTAKWEDRYTNLDAAVREMKIKLPSMAEKIDKAFSPLEEAELRKDVKKLINAMDLTKCSEAKAAIKKLYDDAYLGWSALR